MQKFDAIIVGGGIVGLATAYQCLRRFPDKLLLVLPVESDYIGSDPGIEPAIKDSAATANVGLFVDRPNDSEAR